MQLSKTATSAAGEIRYNSIKCNLFERYTKVGKSTSSAENNGADAIEWAQGQWRCYRNTIQEIPYNTIQTLYKYHTNTPQIPYKYHTNTIQILYKYYKMQ